ncbi:hypothetical protein TIFTF001_053247 [Ficus carica]|uniref:Uncharacterized protein n=1 Tax=Ficus carica TaxID=3494 RepID=A0AA88EHT4_FICCA|nr:hypothetical protein TIFTF001_053247 [Ficus carica]
MSGLTAHAGREKFYPDRCIKLFFFINTPFGFPDRPDRSRSGRSKTLDPDRSGLTGTDQAGPDQRTHKCLLVIRTGLTGTSQACPDQQVRPDQSGRYETVSKNCSLVFRTGLTGTGTGQACPDQQVRPNQSGRSETRAKFARWSGPNFPDRPDRDRPGPCRKSNEQICSLVRTGFSGPAGLGPVRKNSEQICSLVLTGFSGPAEPGSVRTGPEKLRANLLAGPDRIFWTGLTGTGPDRSRKTTSKFASFSGRVFRTGLTGTGQAGSKNLRALVLAGPDQTVMSGPA